MDKLIVINENINEKIDESSNKINNMTDEQIEEYRKNLVDSLKNNPETSDPAKLLEYLQSNLLRDVPSIDRPEKLLVCPHEIVFTVIAHILEENEKGELIASKEICQKNYHIPVPPQSDYNKYMDTFFKHIEKCISSSAKHATKESENTNV